MIVLLWGLLSPLAVGIAVTICYHFSTNQRTRRNTMPTNNNGPVTMTVDELTSQNDIAWQACCWVGDCQWTGEIFHADSYVERGSDDPADDAWADAKADGDEHLDVEHGIVP